MKKIVIKLWRGLVGGVYVDKNEEYDLYVLSDDEEDIGYINEVQNIIKNEGMKQIG